jgi:molecular chaperone DnaJ
MFGSQSHHTGPIPQRGSDVVINYKLNLYDVIFGKEKVEISYLDSILCSVCSGTGGAEFNSCVRCNGLGRTTNYNGPMIITMTCSMCGGHGRSIKEKCFDCNGSGIIKKDRNFEVNIPPGVNNFSKVVLERAGRSGKYGGPPGHLILVINLVLPKLEDMTGEQKEFLRELVVGENSMS